MTATAAPPLGFPEKTLDVAIIGAGFSGICAAIQLREKGITNFRVLEKSDGIGGAWFQNTYPGAACDVPSPLYCYSFEANPHWSRMYAPQIEILSYIDGCADKYGVKPHILDGQQVDTLRFLDEEGVWSIEVAKGEAIKARHVINGSGGLHKPKIPDLPGLEDFNGPIFHTASWDHSVDLEGKRVAIIGSAASAIQVIPRLAQIAAYLAVVQRTPNYVMPRNDVSFSQTQRRDFAQKPAAQRALRDAIYDRLEAVNAPIIQKNSDMGKVRRRQFMDHVREVVSDPHMHSLLIPDYEFGCKRVLLSDDYYQTLNRDNVSLSTGGATGIEEGLVVTGDGSYVEIDVIIMATGFDLAAHSLDIQIYGPGGQDLAQQWTGGAKTLKGACTPGFPNLYWVTGPNTGVATNSAVTTVEAQVPFILKCIEAAGRDKLIAPKANVVEAEDANIQNALKDTVWASGCQSWYLGKDDDDRIEILYPYGARRFAAERETLNLDEFEITPIRQHVQT